MLAMTIQKTVATTISLAVVLAYVPAAAQNTGTQRTTHAAHEQVATDYAKLKNIGVVYGQILAYVEENDCRGARRRSECGPLPMLKVKVLQALRGEQRGDLVLELPYPAQQPSSPEKVPVGEVVLITFVEDTAPEMWSCGALRPCDRGAPKSVLRVVDIFRHLWWG